MPNDCFYNNQDLEKLKLFLRERGDLNKYPIYYDDEAKKHLEYKTLLPNLKFSSTMTETFEDIYAACEKNSILNGEEQLTKNVETFLKRLLTEREFYAHKLAGNTLGVLQEINRQVNNLIDYHQMDKVSLLPPECYGYETTTIHYYDHPDSWKYVVFILAHLPNSLPSDFKIQRTEGVSGYEKPYTFSHSLSQLKGMYLWEEIDHSASGGLITGKWVPIEKAKIIEKVMFLNAEKYYPKYISR